MATWAMRERAEAAEAQLSELESKHKVLRHAVEAFLTWWDMPPYVIDDDDGLRMEVDALRDAIRETA